jgi:assimilatory nitrate reductase catalytic subunit
LFADNADLARWPSWLRGAVSGDIAEYRDFGGGVYRAASFVDDRIEACLFVGPAHDAGDWDVVKRLFAADTLTDDERRMLLSGRSTEGVVSAGPVICACFGVGRASICDAIAAGAVTTAEIGARLKAGTNCGSCLPELKRLIAERPTASGPQQVAVAAH